MTALTQPRFARPRHAGASRFAASWRTLAVAMGTGVSAARAGDDQSKRVSQIARPSDRMQQTTSDATYSTGENGSLETGHSGAGSGYRWDAP